MTTSGRNAEMRDDAEDKFIGQIFVRPLADGRSWVLLREIGYETIQVPAGFVTDFASVPRPLHWPFPPWGRHGFAAVVHDWLYADRSRTRAAADSVFVEAMRELGVGWLQRRLMYRAVRVFGGFAWRKNARRPLRLLGEEEMWGAGRFDLTERAGRSL